MKTRFIKLLTISQLVFVSQNFAQSVASVKTDTPPTIDAISDGNNVDRSFSFQKMSTAQINSITTPATGLIVYNSSINAFQINSGTEKSPLWSTLGTTVANWLVSNNSIASAQEKFTEPVDDASAHLSANN